MRPISLYLRNFKSYGEETPVLNFDAFDAVLLTGENGNGKSSLADAISWCIWGYCKGMDGRKGGMDDLVRTGADEMEVSFVFEEDGNIYKIIRKRDKRRGQSVLDFQIQRGGQFMPISGDRMDETQDKILKTIKLDYDTYLCTGYLSQGKADLFATKKPNERKEILGEILNLQAYEKLQRRAADKKNELQSRLDLIERELERLNQEIGDKEAVQKELSDTQGRLIQLQAEEAGSRDEINRLLKQREEKQALQNKIDDYRKDIEREQKEIASLEEDAKGLRERILGYQEILKREEEIGRSYEELKKLEQEEKLLREQYEEHNLYLRRIEQLKAEMKDRDRQLGYEMALIKKELDQAAAKAEDLPDLLAQVQKVGEQLSALTELEGQLTDLERQLELLSGETVRLSAHKAALENQLQDLRKRYSTLKEAQMDCPVCKRPLEEHQKEELLKEFNIKGQEMKSELQRIQEELDQLNRKHKDLQSRIQAIRKQLKERGSLEGRAALLDKQLKEGQEAAVRLKDLEAQLQAKKELLEKGEHTRDLSENLKKTEDEMKKLGYRPERHQEVKKRIQSLEEAAEKWQELQSARVKMASEGESLDRITKLMEDRKAHIEGLSRLIGDLERAVHDLPQIIEELKLAEGRHQKLQDSIRTLEARRGALEERRKKIEDTEIRIRERKEEQKEIQDRLEGYRILAEVYGKRGIQAAIIENAIPELQDETNRILAKITDGQFTVEFLTQRENKEGNVIETLDIKISDGMDTRKYETYSGGEEFRINFAIRIALAKILAHRAGANLRMLILDEGFGTLDEKGRERLVEVINAIRDEFDKILVITHIPDLKDAFPAQIEVVKKPSGSTFRMVG